MTKTCERNTDELDLEEEEEEEAKHHRVLSKVFRPIFGYPQEFELLQFAHDLALRSRVGGGKNACAVLPLRLAESGAEGQDVLLEVEGPGASRHAAAARFPALFKTTAPELLPVKQVGELELA